jgi:hypothetical protein
MNIGVYRKAKDSQQGPDLMQTAWLEHWWLSLSTGLSTTTYKLPSISITGVTAVDRELHAVVRMRVTREV